MRAAVLVVALLLGLALPAAADDTVDARTVIRSQAEAFGRDDATAAYSFAAPAIKSMFPNAGAFIAMVQAGYAPVYRHRSFEFGTSRIENGVIVQNVQIVDQAGVAWDARYTLERQSDGSLKITGCTLTKAFTA